MELDNLKGKYGDTIDLHILLLRYLWGPGANVAVTLALYNYRKWWSWLHGTLLALAAVLTIAITFPMLISAGFPYPNPDNPTDFQIKIYKHASIGVTCMTLMVVIAFGGILNKMAFMANLNPKTVQKIKWGHRVGGYILLILCKANYYLVLRDSYININIITDSALITFFIARKLLFPKMGAWIIAPKYKGQFEKVRSMKELDQTNMYILFDNYIYNGENLKNNHPGGSKVINAITNKQVDRFLYGAYTADELPETPRRAHSYKSISLLGKPIAELDIPQTFSGFDKHEVECKVVDLNEVIKGTNIYRLKLAKKKGGTFRFDRYRDISQLGRYFTVTLNNSTTRLYSTVNFILDENLAFLRKYSSVAYFCS